MKNSLIHTKIRVRKSSIQGYGVFATENIQENEIIEECHTLFLSSQESKSLNNYVFAAGDEVDALAFGFGSIYNHGNKPNASYSIDLNTGITTFTAIQPIQAGDEILISYGKDWFSSRHAKVKKIPLWRKSWRYFLGMPLRALMVIGVIYAIIACMVYFL